MAGRLRFPALLAATLAVTAGTAYAQQSTRAVQQVPDNIAPHPAPAQPVQFSHQTHSAAGLQCEACHTRPPPGEQMTFPAASLCMSCHAAIASDRPSIARLAELAASDQEIPWVRVYEMSPGITWSHSAHLDAGLQCTACHGDVAQLSEMAMTTAVTAMASCISCHQAHETDAACQTCHAWPAE